MNNTRILAILILALKVVYSTIRLNIDFNEAKLGVGGNSFSYTVALLRKHNFLTTGALISDSWVITDANEVYR